VKTEKWRASPPSWRFKAPLGFVHPREPALTDRPPAGPGWLPEIKHDGFRVLAFRQGERIKVWSRRCVDFTDRFAKIGFLTTEANAIVAPIHPKAMPVILTKPEEVDQWLQADTGRPRVAASSA
jgi:bifunctional non-homologous end joining protein LigD